MSGFTFETDERGVEWVIGVSLDQLPEGWAKCGTCGRAWNDEKSTSVTPTPSARCPFEYEHEPPTVMQEQVVVLRIRRPADGTSPAEWDWPDLIDDDCEVIAVGPVKEYVL